MTSSWEYSKKQMEVCSFLARSILYNQELRALKRLWSLRVCKAHPSGRRLSLSQTRNLQHRERKPYENFNTSTFTSTLRASSTRRPSNSSRTAASSCPSTKTSRTNRPSRRRTKSYCNCTTNVHAEQSCLATKSPKTAPWLPQKEEKTNDSKRASFSDASIARKTSSRIPACESMSVTRPSSSEKRSNSSTPLSSASVWKTSYSR